MSGVAYNSWLCRFPLVLHRIRTPFHLIFPLLHILFVAFMCFFLRACVSLCVCTHVCVCGCLCACMPVSTCTNHWLVYEYILDGTIHFISQSSNILFSIPALLLAFYRSSRVHRHSFEHARTHTHTHCTITRRDHQFHFVIPARERARAYTSEAISWQVVAQSVYAMFTFTFVLGSTSISRSKDNISTCLRCPPLTRLM